MKPELVILVGYPASGKSTWTRENLGDHMVVSKDMMGSNKVKQQAQQLEQHLGAGNNVILDNTNLSLEERAQAIPIAKKHGAKVVCVWVTTPFEECMERNAKREGKIKVPAVAMYGMRKRFSTPSLAEGIDEIRQFGPEAMTMDKIVAKADESIAKAEAILIKYGLPDRSKPPRPAIFLDKDGVLVNDDDFPYVIPKTELMPGVQEALIKLASLNRPIIVISNQAWVAKGRMTMAEVESIFEELKQKVHAFGGRIDGTYFCPHDTKAKCECRKPGIGMLLQAAKDHHIDLKESAFFGDMHTDIECGEKAGLACRVLVNGDKKESNPTHVFATLLEAVDALYMPART
jgi:histidinol-phosphate phosphatase family protein